MARQGLAVALLLTLNCFSSTAGADAPLYGEKGGLDIARKLMRQGRLGEGERLLRNLSSAQAKAIRAGLLFDDEAYKRRHGFTSFDPKLAESLAREAMPALQKEARTDLDSAALLGNLYFWGCGAAVKQDQKLGFSWWKWAAEKGQPRAMALVALSYRDGTGVGQDKKLAVDWIKRASSGGDLFGTHVLAEFYRFGDLVPKDTSKAARLYEQNAKEGYIDSMVWCADLALDRMMKSLGSSDLTSALRYAKAFESWLRKASEAGDAIATLRMGTLLRTGLAPAVRTDPVESYRNYVQAAKSGLAEPVASLACCHFAGWGCKVDPNRADALLKEAIAAAKRDGEAELLADLEKVVSKPTAVDRGAELKEVLGWNDSEPEPEAAAPPPVARDSPDYPPSSADSSSPARTPPVRPKKRRYASQEAQRLANIEMLGQMTGAAVQAGEEAKAAQYRRMTPGQGTSRGPSHYCGAPTLDGTPCQRLVIGFGYCYQHR
jgi:TPR repeat protein